ncbi:hypothetical protein P106B_93 [Rhizobium phage vB_RglS_P106B]|uniref:Uncharacterized protein n=1 Tax=Rhizobium phage vB_RglS_P106B TaxID=1458697 RepID=W6EKK9_9CAUD|nr:hypothetical protein P106B_93 [Rhizobium phage vB_RglS_P106B]AHJ10776.1 hypothetical protein P106B_93 [Rhizobium phage vB_RglS_P106B]
MDGFLRSLEQEAAKRFERLTTTLERVSRAINPASLDDRTRDLFSKPLIAASIRERAEQLAAERDLTPEWIIRQYHNIASASLEHYFDVGEDGFPQIDLSKLTPEQWSALDSIDATEKFTRGGTERHVKIKLKGGMEALAFLAKHAGLDKADNPVFKEYTALPADLAQMPNSASVSELAENYARFIDG